MYINVCMYKIFTDKYINIIYGNLIKEYLQITKLM